MFFVLSKLVFAVIRPLTFLLLLLLAGLGLTRTRWAAFGRRVVVASAAAMAVIAFTPLAPALLSVLEDRFPRPGVVEPAPDGILILGGTLDIKVETARPGVTAFNDSAERMTEVARLARTYPTARIVFTGGTGELFPGGLTEAESARRLFTDFGIPVERLTFEDQSRTTWENAILTRDIVKPAPGSRWLLVTSAYHMPRSVGVFRQAGWPGIVAYPVDYRTRGLGNLWRWPDAASENFQTIETATKEFVGLVAYRLTGRTDALFPAP